VKFVVVVDMRGRIVGEGVGTGKVTPSVGLREGEMKLVSVELLLLGLKRGSAKSGGQVFRAMQAAYVRLLQNPFYEPDEHSPPTGRGGKKITSRRFTEDMKRIGESWVPGVGSS
jgi:hypothetical protein